MTDDGARFARVDLVAMAREVGVDLEAAFGELRALYDDVDARNTRNTRDLGLPCHQGCDACCHESVFLTPLEFFFVWHWGQENLSAEQRDAIVEEGLRLFAEHKALIDALEAPPPVGHKDHFAVARELRFRCPLLGATGACLVYPVRELYARLFGCSFNDVGGVYGCELVGAHLGGKTVTLVQLRPTARRLNELPLTGKRQVYPYYLALLYGA